MCPSPSIVYPQKLRQREQEGWRSRRGWGHLCGFLSRDLLCRDQYHIWSPAFLNSFRLAAIAMDSRYSRNQVHGNTMGKHIEEKNCRKCINGQKMTVAMAMAMEGPLNLNILFSSPIMWYAGDDPAISVHRETEQWAYLISSWPTSQWQYN